MTFRVKCARAAGIATTASVIAAFTLTTLATPLCGQSGAPAYVPLDSLSPPRALASLVTVHAAKLPLRAVLAELARQASVGIVYDPALSPLDRTVNADFRNISAATALMRVLDGSGLQAMVSSAGSIVLTERPKRGADRGLMVGVVRQPEGPLSGVHLLLAGTRFETTSDAEGRFNFGIVPAGTYTLRALRMGFAPVSRSVRVAPAEGSPQIEVMMTPAAVPVDAVIVTPGYVGVMQPGIARGQTLSRQQIETVPQLGEDVYRTIGRLPGVASDDFSAKFNIRGESSEALYVTLDGLPLIEPFHLRDIGNSLSIIDLASLGRAELITGGPSAEYGDQIAGVFKLYTVEPRQDRARTSVGISVSNLRAMSQGGFAGGKGSWLVSGRRGFLELMFKLAKIEDSIRPTYNDLFAKVTYALPGDGRLGVHVLHAGDRMHYIGTNEPSLESHYSSDYFWLTAAGHAGSRLRYESVAWANVLDWGRVGTEVGQAPKRVSIDDSRVLHTLGARQDWSVAMSEHALFKFGAEVTHETARYDYSKLFVRQVPSAGQVVVRTDTGAVKFEPSADQVGVYLSQRVRPFEALTLEAGARYDRASHSGDAYVSPRFNAAWQPAKSTSIRASWGTHAQSQSVFALQVEDGDKTYQPAERSRQASIGIEHLSRFGVTLRAEAYDRDVRDVRSRFTNASARVDPFSELASTLTLIAPTRASARGVELSVDRESGRRIDWSASYVISSSRQELNGAWTPRPNDQPRALRGDWSFHPANNQWRLTVSGVRHSGWPFTPESIRIDTIQSGQNQSLWVTRSPGPLYSKRASAYQRIDARWTRFIDTRSGRVSMFLDIYNLLNNSNEREKYVNVAFNKSGPSYYEGSRFSLPRIPSFGINWEF